MKNKILFLFLPLLIIIGTAVNSCKKDSSSSQVQSLITGTWQLATITVTNYLGGNITSVDTLNNTCDTTQLFTFKSDNTCTYTNFDCYVQPTAKGTWSVSNDGLYLMSTMSCTDTLPHNQTGTTKPFAYSKIQSLGVYSLIIYTGDFGTYVTSTTRRRIVQYGFVRKQLPAGN